MNRWSWLVAALAAACVSTRRDPVTAAQRLIDRGDLLGALRIVEQTPLRDPRFEAADDLAKQLGGRMAIAYREVAAGMSLRAAWRDDEALLAFRRAAAAWPQMPGLDDRIAGVEKRVPWLHELVVARATPAIEADERASISAADPLLEPVEDGASPGYPPAVGLETRAGQPSPQAPAERAASNSTLADVATSEEVAQRLAGVEARLGNGEIENSIIELMVLYRSHRADPRVRQRLSRLLSQRALMRFGCGAIGEALEDWQRVLAIEPDNREVQALVAQARAELSGASVR